MADDWTDDELRTSVIAYHRVMEADAHGEPISPTAVYRELIAGPLSARSEGAVGRRMSNISAVYAAERLPVARRFGGALTNVGVNITRRILDIHA